MVYIIGAVLVLVGVIWAVTNVTPSFGKAPNPKVFQGHPQFKDGKFVNTIPTASMDFSKVPQLLKEYVTRSVESAPKAGIAFKELDKEKHLGKEISYVWLGHATLLIHFEGKYYLLDPVLSERVSPFSFQGPKRYFPSPISVEQLPPIEAVLISHDHYDHLDYETILALKEKTKHFILPLGVQSHLLHWGVSKEKIKTLDWWESQTLGSVTINATPARHFSGRKFSQNNTFWNSYALSFGNTKVYFGGDSGIFDEYAIIGEKFGGFDVAFMPIGAYNEKWHDIHLDPDEAYQAAMDLNTKVVFPIHWGTFDLALHSWHEPGDRFLKLLQTSELKGQFPPPGVWINTKSEVLEDWWTTLRTSTKS